MAINVRYDNAGDLGQLAVAVGQGQNRDRRFAQEQQLVNSVRSYYANQEANQLAAARLKMEQMAIQSQLASRTPTSSAQLIRGPFAQSIEQQLPQSSARVSAPTEGSGYIQTAGFGNTQQGTRFATGAGGITGVENGSNLLSPTQVGQRGNFVQGGQTQQADPAGAAKQAFLDQYKEKLMPEEYSAASLLAQDPKVTMEDLAVRVGPALNRSRPPKSEVDKLTENAVFTAKRDRVERKIREATQEERRILEEADNTLVGGAAKVRSMKGPTDPLWAFVPDNVRALWREYQAVQKKKADLDAEETGLVGGNQSNTAAAVKSAPVADPLGIR